MFSRRGEQKNLVDKVFSGTGKFLSVFLGVCMFRLIGKSSEILLCPIGKGSILNLRPLGRGMKFYASV